MSSKIEKIVSPGSNLPCELVNEIIMIQRPKFPFLNELLHFGWSAYQCPGCEKCPYADGDEPCIYSYYKNLPTTSLYDFSDSDSDED